MDELLKDLDNWIQETKKMTVIFSNYPHYVKDYFKRSIKFQEELVEIFNEADQEYEQLLQ